MRTPPLLADFSHARACKPFCENSLTLPAWQKSFVESIRRVNNSIQLIFATHAPEIIGKYSDHAVKLQKKINPLAKEMDDMYDE